MTSATRLLDTSLGSLLTGDNRAYLEDLRRRFENNPDSVDPSWHPLPLSIR
jgi:2-oxoglutarate dehydrogenase complex dehydrogenase (E1) component-like enzyme